MDKNKILLIVKKNINLGGIAAELLDEVLEPALLEVVKDTANPFDDMLFKAVYPKLEEEMKRILEAKINEIYSSLGEK